MSDRSSAAAGSAAVAASSSHALPAVGPDAPLLDKAANPLGILAQFELATTGLGPKLVAGGLSCMLISGMLNPMDVIKVRLQTQRSMDGPPRYQGFAHAFKSIWREEGYRRGLMRGFTASMLREASYSSLRMGLYDAVKILLSGPGSSSPGADFSLLTKIAAGSFSGALGSFIAVPTDLIKIRFQGFSKDKPNPYPHSWAAFMDIYRQGGVRGLYSGATPTVARAAILTGAQLSSYDHSKRTMLRSGLFADTPGTHLIASIISGLVTCTAVNPADVIKTRIMVDSKRELYRNPLDCVLKTLRNEGPGAFLKGWTANYLRLGPHFIVSLPLAEWIRVKLGAGSM